FVTDYGYPLSLIPITNFTKDASGQVYPVAGSAMMLLCSPASENPSYPWYLTVAGSFTINIDSSIAKYTDTNGQMRLLCGLSGLETISFTPQTSAATGDQLVLQPNQAAFTPQFPVSSTGNVVGSNTTQKWLTTDYLTTWGTILKGATGNPDIVYHAQAQGAALFSAGLDGIPKDSNFLGYYPANSGTISKASANFFFPLVAYSSNTLFPQGVSLEQFEQQILNPSRRTIVAQNLSQQAENAVKQRALAKKAMATANLTAGVAACPDGCICTTSPQGFYVAVDTTTFVWDILQLASNQYPVAGGGLSPVYTLSFETLGATLQSAFQSNQLFLVISYNETLADGKTFVLGDFNNEMYIEGWPFILNVPISDTFGQYNNVLIFKFCGGALIDRVQNIQLWNTPNSFNDNSNAGLPNISMWLQQYIQDGINRFKGGDLNYSKFNSIATDPTWQGMVALGVQVDLDNFPAELQGLLAGIDLSRFNAHHFGIDLSIIQNNGGTLTMQPASSLFGLIDYEDQTYESLGSSVTNYQTQAPINTSVDYVYSVLTLKVLFVNSKIVNFSSYIAITLNKLFGETVKSTNRQNLVILDGTYENHDGVPSYTFNTTGDQLLYLDSQIINEVEILKASFNTIVSQNSTTPDAAVDARFSFWGYINFFSLKGFDLLSFGSEIGLAPNSSGLAFSNLFVDLSFPLDKPTSQTFTFDIGQISFDIGNSTPRRASLYPHFPLQLTGMTSGDATSTPGLQGFLDVNLPGLQQQQDISGNWYGLVFTLNMGTPGALASAAGFNATFVIGWNVGATGAAAGLQLPGVNPQAPFLSLQGILRVDIGSIQLLVASDGVSYLMKINNIDLKVFTLSFPPGGSTSFFLFGNPASSTSQPQSMGWYAAYLES
ncbi:MAG TPA: hypothetical protein VNZ86_07935, partial [Bacteroidia bacterium]|nr:hypothetical protein [Bacteroidia bacterium]